MIELLRGTVVIGLAVAISACGGGDGSGGGSQTNEPINTPGGNLEIGGPEEDIQGKGRFSIRGQVSSPISTFIDIDTNDVSSGSSSNNSPADAQPLPNVATVHGFASREGTGTGSPRERFSDTPDRNDYYRVSLQAGQRVVLQVADAEGSSSDSVNEGDLDLCLIPALAGPIAGNVPGNPVLCSRTSAEFEEIRVQVSTTYFINVEAFRGISKYVLELLPASNNRQQPSQFALPAKQTNSLPIVPGEVIIEYQVQSGEQPTGPQLLTLDGYSEMAAMLGSGSPTNDLLAAELGIGTSLDEPSLSELTRDGLLYKWTTAKIKQLAEQPNVLYASPNFWRYGSRTPNDPLYTPQYHYEDIFLPQAWDLTTGETTVSGRDVIVAVIDTGVYLAHDDLESKLVDGYDFISSPANSNDGDGIDPNPDDPGDNVIGAVSSWHGTHVSGTVAAASDNLQGVAGASWGAKIMPIRALGLGGGTAFDVLQGMRYAAGLSNTSGTLPPQRADILNLSLGSSGRSDADQATINEIRAAGVIIVAAAGNDDSDEPSYPASYDNVISVSAIGPDRTKAPYSSFGNRVDVAAPGGDSRRDTNLDGQPDGVFSTYVRATSAGRSATYDVLQGTSMATPHVAGVLALMLASNASLTPADIDRLLAEQELTDEAGEPGRDNIYGHGIINALKAVQTARAASGGGNPPSQPVLASNPSRLSFDSDDTTQSFVVDNLSDSQDPEIEVTSSESWLTVEQLSPFSNGQAQFVASVNRDELVDGLYEATIQIIPDNGNTLDIPVNLAVGDIQTGGELAQQYVVLIDATTFERLAEVKADADGNYQFNDLPEGRYRVIAGSDIDVDLTICQNGETCGGFPNRGAEQVINLDEDRADVDFVVSVVGGGGFSNQAVAN